jgi:hypothetical protein
MKALRKLELVGALVELSKGTVISGKAMKSLVGCSSHQDEKNIYMLFPKFSWAGQKAVQMALIVNRHGKRSFDGKIAMMEIGKILPLMKCDEMLAIMTAMNHGTEGLHSIKKQIKMLRVKK